MRLRLDPKSISIRLLVLVLIITIVPILFITFNYDRVLTADKNDDFKQKIRDGSYLVSQAYTAKVEADRMLAVKLSQDPGMLQAIQNNSSADAKLIVDAYLKFDQGNPRDTHQGLPPDDRNPGQDQYGPEPENADEYFAPTPSSAGSLPILAGPRTPNDVPQSDNARYLVTIATPAGALLSRSAKGVYTDHTHNPLIEEALNGSEYSVTEVVPGQVISASGLGAQVNATGVTDGLAIVNVVPVKDASGEVIGAVSIFELLNDNFDLVNSITSNTNACFTIIQNDTRITTSLKDSSENSLIGTRELPEVTSVVLSENRPVEGIYEINNVTMYTHFMPLRNRANQTVGMLFVGYDIGPGLDKLSKLREQGIITSIAASIIFVSLGYMMVRSITRPVRRIVEIADSIAAGNLDTPVETGAVGGEIGQLTDAIKIMVGTMVANIKERINYNESILKSISDPLLAVDKNGKIIFLNEQACLLTGYGECEAMGRYLPDILRITQDSKGMVEILENMKYVSGFEEAIVSKTGRPAFVRGSSSPVRDASGEITAMIILLQDITWQRESEEKIKISLHEKEILLKEIHHRVKNNLQIISSLLSLQTAYIKDPEDVGLFKECQDRVRSMALIHERLYQSKDFARISFAEYIKTLAGNLVRSYGTGAVPVSLVVNAPEVALSIDLAIPCGLIINEAVTNSLKYAFPDARPGEIRIDMSRIDGPDRPQYRLILSDNGIGLPPDLDIYNTNSLGLQLITTLTDQLHGTLQVNRLNGTEYIFTFPEAGPYK